MIFLKLTPIRKEILDIIKKSNRPICAKNIKEEFSLQADLSNIYRNLNVLELDRKISSISFRCVKYYYASQNQNGHFILCKKCGEIQSFNLCHEHLLQKTLEEQYGYKFTSHSLYFEGYCKICKKT